MPGLSVALIFCNEAPKLPAWLAAVQPFADEICALDSGSSDQGPDILKAAGARVEFQPWLGYGRQRNRAADFCRGDWILFLDADERPDAALRQTLLDFKRQRAGVPMGYELEYKVFFFGRFLRHGGFFPERHLRLARRGQGLWSEREVHEKLIIDGPTARLRGGFVEHHSYAAIAEYLRKMERYSAQAARQMYGAGRRTTPFKAAAHGGFAFAQRYFLRLGFLDGFAGYLAARLEGVYTLSKYTRLWELQQENKP